MSRVSYIICVILLLTVFPVSAQLGKDGSRTVNTAGQIVNEYTTLTANANAGDVTIQVAGSSLNSNGRFSGPLSPGDLIFIIQVQGAEINGGSWWWNFGYISNYYNCGNNEMAQVLSVPNGTSIMLTCPLSKSYTVAGKVQVVRVPRLSALTINNGGSITCDSWNGSTGGVVVLEVSGVTTLSAGGEISAGGKGFRGGTNSDMNSVTGVTIYASTDNNEGAEKGEGIAGSWSDYDLIGGRYSKNAAANGGGGGNAHNGGGGGGANGSRIYSWNGKGNPDTTIATWKAAWDLESANFHKNQSDGGGRGGYTYSWQNLDATAVGPGDASWGGDNRRNEGGQGGRPLDYNFGKLYLGGGGGAGDQGPNTNWGGNGGNGGGLIYLRTFNAINGSGLISSNGNPGTDAQGTAPMMDHAGIDGAGGGGAGGTIYIEAAGAVASSITLSVNGGKGGDQLKTRLLEAADGEAEGPGGGGGGGMIQMTSGSPVKLADGGMNGNCYAQTDADCGVVEFRANGATKGGGGTLNYFITTYSISVKNDTVCQGAPAMFIVEHSGTVPSGTMMQWYDAAIGGNLLGTGDTLLLSGISTNTTVYVGACPGTYRVAAQAVIIPFSFDAGSDLTLCNATSDTLHASGGASYSWSPSAPLSNAGIADPVVTLAATTEFFVTITNSTGCSGTDSVMVYVNTVNAQSSPDTAVCAGVQVQISASGGDSYFWSTGDITAAILLSPVTSQNYTVTVSAGLCVDTVSTFIGVNPVPVVALGPDSTLCDGMPLGLNAGNPGSTYQWQDGSSLQGYNVVDDGTYAVTVTNGDGCSDSDSIVVTILPVANASITPVSPLCANAGIITLQAAQGGGQWSGPGIISPSTGSFDPSNAGSGSHEITYMISGLCGDNDQVTIEVYEVPALSAESGFEPCTVINAGWIDLSVSGGLTPYTFMWNQGAVTEDLNQLEAGVYTVTVTEGHSCSSTLTENIVAPTVDCYIPHIYIPNIFTPDGDGSNDLFIVRGAGIVTFEMMVYDRWGEKVFKSVDADQGWDGRFRGQDCADGVYYYRVSVTLTDGQEIKKGGSITLLR